MQLKSQFHQFLELDRSVLKLHFLYSPRYINVARMGDTRDECRDGVTPSRHGVIPSSNPPHFFNRKLHFYSK